LASAQKFRARGLRHYLTTGGVIAYPTESIFGLGCDPGNRNAVKRVLLLKRRPQRKGLILIADKLERLTRYLAPLNREQIQQMQASWADPTKPHTWLVPTAVSCPKWLTGRHQSIAIRVTHHPLAARICKNTGMAIVSTSANRSGCQPAKNTRMSHQLFGKQLRILNGMTGGAKRPSTIQDLLTGRVLRK